MTKAKRISQIPEADRPREKLQRKGAAALSDFELLEVLVGTGSPGASVGDIAQKIQKLTQKGMDAITLEALTELKGVSQGHATKILASIEWARRYLVKSIQPLRSQEDILAYLHFIRLKRQEHFVCLTFDGGDRLIGRRTIAIGVLDSVEAHPREVFTDAIADRAAYVIVAHNHPSGDPQPSREDVLLTQSLVGTGQILGIPLRDHLILTPTQHFSCKEHHLLEWL